MSHDSNIDPATATIAFYLTPGHNCSYLHNREAMTLFLDPNAPVSEHLYTRLTQDGFRRSGRYIYRPRCPHCESCQPLRIPVQRFHPNRSQRRIMAQNSDLTTCKRTDEFHHEHFGLYQRYLHARHRDGGMDHPEPAKYMDFLTCPWSMTQFVEFRLQSTLLAVAVIDELEDGYSAVYTFFDPEHARRSLGNFAILWEIEQAKNEGLHYLYLGYLINKCRKMSYKSDFKPHETLQGQKWVMVV